MITLYFYEMCKCTYIINIFMQIRAQNYRKHTIRYTQNYTEKLDVQKIHKIRYTIVKSY